MDCNDGLDLTVIFNRRMYEKLRQEKTELKEGLVAITVKSNTSYQSLKTLISAAVANKDYKRELVKDLQKSFSQVSTMGAVVCYNVDKRDVIMLKPGQLITKTKTSASSKYNEKILEQLFPESQRKCLILVDNDGTEIFEVYKQMSSPDKKPLSFHHPTGNTRGKPWTSAQKMTKIKEHVLSFLCPKLDKQVQGVLFGVSDVLWNDWKQLSWDSLSGMELEHFRLKEVSLEGLVLAGRSKLESYHILKENEILDSFYSSKGSMTCTGLMDTIKAIDNKSLATLIISDNFNRTVFTVHDPTNMRDRIVLGENEEEKSPIIHGHIQLEIRAKESLFTWLSRKLEGSDCRVVVVSTQLGRGSNFGVEVGIGG